MTTEERRRPDDSGSDEIERLRATIARMQDAHLKYIGETTADIECLTEAVSRLLSTTVDERQNPVIWFPRVEAVKAAISRATCPK